MSIISDFDSNQNKRKWTSEEDFILKQTVEFHGAAANWSLIATQIPGRTAKQLRERWHNHLNRGVKKGEWTMNEDEIISETQKLIGNQWAKIAGLLNGRTDNDVKNRFHLIQRRKGEESAARSIRNKRKEQNQQNKRMRFSDINVDCLSQSQHTTQSSTFSGDGSDTGSVYSSDDSCSYTGRSDALDRCEHASSRDSLDSGCIDISMNEYNYEQEMLDILASDALALQNSMTFTSKPSYEMLDYFYEF